MKNCFSYSRSIRMPVDPSMRFHHVEVKNRLGNPNRWHSRVGNRRCPATWETIFTRLYPDFFTGAYDIQKDHNHVEYTAHESTDRNGYHGIALANANDSVISKKPHPRSRCGGAPRPGWADNDPGILDDKFGQDKLFFSAARPVFSLSLSRPLKSMGHIYVV